MQLRLFKTLWGHASEFESAVNRARHAGFQGIEGPAPGDAAIARRQQELLDDAGLDYIAEITTAGTYVPNRHATLDDHLESLKRKLDQSLEMSPEFISCLGGCDAWPEEQSLEFFSRAMELANNHDITISFETHRGRSFYNPWTTQRIVEQLPEIKLTCDFSHWCVVCERLMDTELDVIEFLAPHAHHVHARVGYDQGPQVPHPEAPEYRKALRAHQGWWEIIWKSQLERGYNMTTMTPEFGPDGYLHEAPFSREPVGELWQINQWMAHEERRHFADFIQEHSALQVAG
jgi:sugar phosphate isomerase/epimerase